jgi:pre-mRNA-splicing factor CWC22
LSSPPPPREIVDVSGVEDVVPVCRAERKRKLTARMAVVELEKAEEKKGGAKEKEFDAMPEFAGLTSSRSGGVHMPPARLRALQATVAQDRSSAEY